jgi:hypothetical protein
MVHNIKVNGNRGRNQEMVKYFIKELFNFKGILLVE